MPDKFNTLPDYNVSRPLDEPTYRVIYHLNNDDITLLERFIIDTNVYATGDIVQLQWCDESYYSSDGTYAYTFLGWSFSKELAFPRIIDRYNTTYEIKHRDVHLYAQWDKVPTFTIDASGGILLKEDYRSSLTHFKIPEYIYGRRITTIKANAFKNSMIQTIIIPANISYIETEAFDGWQGDTLLFVDNKVTEKYPALTIDASAFSNTPNLLKVVLPYRAWFFPGDYCFPPTDSKELQLYIRNRREFLAGKNNVGAYEEIEDFISPLTFTYSLMGIVYKTTYYWGYND